MSRAPRICSEIACSALVYDPTKRKCPAHYIPWPGRRNKWGTHNSGNKERNTIRGKVFARANGECEHPQCVTAATVLDRVDNLQGYSIENCQALCQTHSAIKSSSEGHAGQGHRSAPLPKRPQRTPPKPYTVRTIQTNTTGSTDDTNTTGGTDGGGTDDRYQFGSDWEGRW
jgi:hypothetical protein